MNTQDLINEARAARTIICDGMRQFSEMTDSGIECQIITRDDYNWKVQDYVVKSTTVFTQYGKRISRKKAEEILSK
jgi:uncharacterized protein YeeX (DUF496 family)